MINLPMIEGYSYNSMIEILRNVLHATGGEVEDSCTLVTATYIHFKSFLPLPGTLREEE